MKRYSLIMVALLLLGGSTVVESCKNKKATNTTEQNKTDSAAVQVSDDKTLRSSVDDVVKNYGDVKADVNDGVVTLRGSIKRDDLQTLMMKIQELKPKKVENQLVIN